MLAKVHIVKSTVFPVVRYGHKSWTIKKAEHQRTDTDRAGEESLGQQGDQISQSERESVLLSIHWKTEAEAETLLLWPHNVKN